MLKLVSILCALVSASFGFLEFDHEQGFSSADVKALQTRLEEEKAKRILIENDLSVVMGKLESMKRDITALQHSTSVFKNGPYAFQVKSLRHITLGVNQRMTFPEILLNHGNAYDPRHSVFHTPVNGTYLFSLSICSTANHYIFLDLMKNGTAIGQVLAGDTVYNSCNTATIVTQLIVGEDVWAQHEGARGDEISNDAWSTLTGILIANSA